MTSRELAKTVKELKLNEERSMGRGSTLLDSCGLKGDVVVVVLEMEPTTWNGRVTRETRAAIRTPRDGRSATSLIVKTSIEEAP